MRHIFMKAIAWILCATSLGVHANVGFTWQEVEYQHKFADFNGDGIADLFLQANDDTQVSRFVLGAVENEAVQYLPENQFLLPQLIYQLSWSVENAEIRTADFNGDAFDDLLVAFAGRELAVTFLGNEQGLNLSLSPDHSYSTTELPWLNDKRDFDIYPGDFNGDFRQDLLAVSQDKYEHYLMHSDENGQLSVAQKIKKNVQWGKKKAERIIILDYNNDGRDDVFALAKKKNKKHYVALSDENGHLKKAKKIKEKIQNKHWNSDDYTVLPGYANNDDYLDLIRLNNRGGGVDENGETIEPPADGDFDDVNDSCDQLFMTPESEEEGLTCAPWGNEKTASAQALELNTNQLNKSLEVPNIGDECNYPMDSFSNRSINVIVKDPCLDIPPPTPTSIPSVAKSYNPVNIPYTVSWSAVSGAVYYTLWESADNVFYSPVYTGSSLSTTRTHSQYGYRYYKYQACNFNACSGLSSYRRIVLYTAPGTPRDLTASPDNVNTGETFNVSFGQAGGSMDGTVYTVYVSKDGGTESVAYTVTRTTWRETGYDFDDSQSSPGSYRYRAQGCSPNAGCGGSAYETVTVNLPNTAPTARNDDASVNEDSSVYISVLNNDSDPENDALTPIVTSNPSHGSVFVQSNKTIRYIPAFNYYGSDSFKYKVNDGALDSGEATVYITVHPMVEGTVSAPTITPGIAPNTNQATISLSTTTAGADIYYTTNGATPTTSSIRYTSTFTITGSKTIKAIGVKTDYADSPVSDFTPPKTGVAGSLTDTNQVYNSSVSVNLAGPSGATIYYTTNGTNPTTSSSVYGSPITLTSSRTIKTMAVKLGNVNSDINSLPFTINQPPTASAGSDQLADESTSTVNIPVTLSGSGTDDEDGQGVSYRWTQTAGVTVGISNDRTSQPSFNTPIVSGRSTLTFKLTVTDRHGATGSDYVNVVINNRPTAINHTPVGGKEFKSTEDIIVSATGSDSDGSVSEMQFKLEYISVTGSAYGDPNTWFAGAYNSTNGRWEYNFGTRTGVHHKYQIITKVKDNNGAWGTYNLNNRIWVNQKPSITGQDALSIFSGESLTLTADHFVITDDDSDFTFNIQSGANYTVSGSTITPAANFVGTITVPFTINDGLESSDTYNAKITVTNRRIYFIHTDLLGTPVAETDTNGDVQQ